MTAKHLPRYPVYIPSKGRYDTALTAKFLDKDGVPFWLVVEPQEADEYIKRFGEHRVLVLPFSNLGQGSIPARNWIKEHATAAGHLRHWQLDDNIKFIRRFWREKRIPCHSGVALRVTEDFSDRYENVAIAGLNYSFFAVPGGHMPPFHLNCRVYSCTLVLNSLPFGWRGRYNEDTDLCLQALGQGWCTVLMNIFLTEKMWTMKLKGGNTDQLYKGDGRLKMARALERMWPGVVEVDRRFQRPQHVVKDNWRKFDTPLIRRTDIDWDNLPPVDEYGMALVENAPVESDTLKNFIRAKYTGDTTGLSFMD